MTPPPIARLPDLEAVKKIARAAGEIVLPYFLGEREALEITFKEDASPVTKADMASHEFLCGELKTLALAIPIVSEEGVAGASTEAGPFWLVDPLDGTREFVNNIGEFTINIALIDGGVARLGVVHVPALGVTYFASERKGAFKQNAAGEIGIVRTRKANPAKLIALASRNQGNPEETKIRKCWPKAEVKRVGSALKMCLIAESSADFYFREHLCMGWDTAASQCVLEEAGGKLMSLEGKALAYDRAKLANPSLVAVGDPGFNWQAYLKL